MNRFFPSVHRLCKCCKRCLLARHHYPRYRGPEKNDMVADIPYILEKDPWSNLDMKDGSKHPCKRINFQIRDVIFYCRPRFHFVNFYWMLAWPILLCLFYVGKSVYLIPKKNNFQTIMRFSEKCNECFFLFTFLAPSSCAGGIAASGGLKRSGLGKRGAEET
jgi:hypothetical protein